MSDLERLMNTKDCTPVTISEYADSITTIDDMLMFSKSLTNILGVSITQFVTSLQGKKISIVLNSILNELDDVFSGEEAFLEKYLIGNTNPTIVSKVEYTGIRYPSLKEELLFLFRRIGIRQTVLLYLVIMHHMR